MPRKQNKPQPILPQESDLKRRQEPPSEGAAAHHHAPQESAAAEAIRAQQRAGNRAALETLEAHQKEEEQDVENRQEAPENQSETTPSNQHDLHEKSSKLPSRTVRKRLESSRSTESDWDLLFGGEEDAPPASPPLPSAPAVQRSLRGLTAHADFAQQPTQPPSRIRQAPLRPPSHLTGHHQYYALTPFLHRPERWINPDRTPESLCHLPPNHPLLLVQICLKFWFTQAARPLSKFLMERSQEDTRETGHLERLIRALGLLLLVQELEAQQLGRRKTADITALLLQEKVIDDVRDLEFASKTVESTPKLFLQLVSNSTEKPLVETTESSPASEPCRLLSLALKHSLPTPAVPALATPYWVPKEPVEPELEALDTLYTSLWDSTSQTNPAESVSESAQSLLEACGMRRHWYAAQACALWRCRGSRTAKELHSTLVGADEKLRGIAIAIHQTQVALESGAVDKDVLAMHRQLLGLRESLQALDQTTHESLVMAASQPDPEDVKEPSSLSNCSDFLLAELRDGRAPPNPKSKPDERQNLSPAERLLWAWCQQGEGHSSDILHNLLREGDNPWMEMDLVLTQGEPHALEGSEMLRWENDPVAAGLWGACLREVCMDHPSKS